jgi:hypothetical protein
MRVNRLALSPSTWNMTIQGYLHRIRLEKPGYVRPSLKSLN